MDPTDPVGALRSPDVVAVAEAIYQIGESGDRPLGSAVLTVAEESTDENVMRQAAWALGKLQHEPATHFVIRASQSSDRNTRRGAYWALGQLGGGEATRRLHDALATEVDEALRAVIGGALKSAHGGNVRAPASKVVKRAQMPAPADEVTARLLEALADPDLDHQSKVELREKLLEHDPGLFERYMASVRAAPSVARALNSDAVYRDNF